MTDKNMDLRDMKSSDIGNLISKTLVEYDKEALQEANPTDTVDYGDLPSRTLSELGKQVVSGKLS